MSAILRPTVQVRDVARFVDAQCIVVNEQAPIENVLAKFVENPGIRVLSVVDKTGTLVGVIPLLLAIDYVLFWRDWVSALRMLELGRAPEWTWLMRASTARELAIPVTAVHPHEPIEKAMQLMHQHQLEGLPVVDEKRKVIGYLDAAQVVTVCSGVDSQGESPVTENESG